MRVFAEAVLLRVTNAAALKFLIFFLVATRAAEFWFTLQLSACVANASLIFSLTMTYNISLQWHRQGTKTEIQWNRSLERL